MYEQDRFMVRLRQQLMGRSDVVAAWLCGSFGRNTPDPYSDIDVALLFASSESREHAWAQRQAFCTGILAYVPAKSADNPKDADSHVVLYANGTMVDFRYLLKSSLKPYWLDSEIKILKDDAEQTAARLQLASQGMTKGVRGVSSAELASLDDQFYLSFWDCYRRARRGTPAGGIEDYLQLVASVLPTLLAALPKQSAARQQLIELHYSGDAAITLAHLRQLITAYRAARQEIVSANRIDFRPNSSFERELDRALQK